MRRWQSGKRRKSPSPYDEAPKPAPEPRDPPKIEHRPIRCGAPESIAALMAIYNDDVKAAIRREQRAGSHLERTQGDDQCERS